ncbi:MAG: 50S ribosomal protein L35 [Elusimicrobiota bacterium]|jgi:large subunit ribosomal protein L35
MPKIKSHSGAKKRFLKTASGKWKFKRAGSRHILTPNPSSHGRFLRKDGYLNEVDGEKIRKLLPYA